VALGGPNNWPEPFRFDALYIAGTWVPMREVQSEPTDAGCWALPTQGGTHQFQRPYRGEDKPKDLRSLRHTFQVQADSDAAWYALKKAKAKCAPFYFGDGARQVDVFPATSGTVYRLTSPLAAGIVPGIAEDDYPTIVELDDVVDPSAADVAGQDVTANADGEIAIAYTPVHLVWFSQLSESLEANNAATLNIVLDSILRP
jgi:hypothetical protein